VSDRIFLRGIVLFGRHGLIPEEAVLGQRFEVDLDCFLDLSAGGRADRIGQTIDYAAVYETVRHTVESERFGLIEALAERIAERLFGEFAPLAKVRVEVRKPGAPIRGHFDTVGVEITRERRG
jgi:dihydroneopterin aldolase